MSMLTRVLIAGSTFLMCAGAQQNAPNVSQVLMYSATAKSGIAIPAGTIPSVYTYTQPGQSAFLSGPLANGDTVLGRPQSFTISGNLAALNNALNASIATALSIVPLASPTSGIIERKDPVTGVELPVSSTLGPIFTERAETIGRGKFYIGFSHQDYHFTKFNGQSLNALSVMFQGNTASNVYFASGDANPLPTNPVTFNLGADIRLSQDIAFLTVGATNHIDITLGLPMVHASAASRVYNGNIYTGTGFGGPGSSCWCTSTFAPATPLLQLPEVNQASQSKTGFGDILLRFKGSVYSPKSSNGGLVVALGTDLRLPTGDEQNLLGTGTTSVKPFVAVSLYSKPVRNSIVFSPHFDLGWQYSGKSILGSDLQPAQSGTPAVLRGPFTTAGKGFLPDVLSWAAGAEVALGRRNTLIVDVLGNEIGIVHGIPNVVMQTIDNKPLPTGPVGDPTNAAKLTVTSARGLVRTNGLDSFHQTTLSLGYKARLIGKLVANVNFLVRLDDNGLTARVTPLYGLGYSF